MSFVSLLIFLMMHTSLTESVMYEEDMSSTVSCAMEHMSGTVPPDSLSQVFSQVVETCNLCLKTILKETGNRKGLMFEIRKEGMNCSQPSSSKGSPASTQGK